MKRFIGILITFTYLLSSLGVLVNFHYCHDELKEVAFYQDVSSCCCEGEIEEISCCENTTVVLKGEQSAQVNIASIELELDFDTSFVPTTPQKIQLPSLFPTLSVHLVAENPPEKDRTILYQKLLLYA